MHQAPLVRTCLVLVACLSASAQGPARPASPASEPPYKIVVADELPIELPFELARTQILVDGVRVDGEGPYRFLLDTGGMGGGRIDSSLVEALGLATTGQIQAGDGTGRRGRAMPLHEVDLDLGGLRFHGVRVLSRDYNRHGAAVRGHIDGVLGFHLFHQFLLTLDYPGRKIRIERGALPEPDGEEILTLETDPVPMIEVQLAGELRKAHLDSGAMGPVSVSDDLAEDFSFTSPPVEIGQARTLTGTFSIREAPLDGELRIGAATIRNPRVVVGAPLRGVNLGGQILQNFVLTFDQRNGRIRLIRPEGEEPAPR